MAYCTYNFSEWVQKGNYKRCLATRIEVNALKAFKRAKPNWPPILKEEISGHKSEKAYLTKWIQ